MTDADRKDAMFPILAVHDEPPGRWENGRWQGDLGWRTRHGQALVRWYLGSPVHIAGALGGNGERIEAEHVLDLGWRRPTSSERDWIYGQVEIGPDDVRFIDSPEQPSYTPPAPAGGSDLEADLAHDAPFLRDLKDMQFARAAYMTFANHSFMKAGTSDPWDCGERQAAALVAGLRGRGDSYLEFYPFAGIDGLPTMDRQRRVAETEASFAEFLEEHRSELAEYLQEQGGKTSLTLPVCHRLYADISRFETIIAKLTANADIFERVDAHLKRLGWRMLDSE